MDKYKGNRLFCNQCKHYGIEEFRNYLRSYLRVMIGTNFGRISYETV